MCYTVDVNSVTLKCSVCNSPLIEVSTVTEKVEGSRFPQTTTVYRCSDEKCQEEKDKQTAKRIKLKEDRMVEEGKRSEARLRTREANKLKKTELAP